jgi:predicted Zn-dependent protease
MIRPIAFIFIIFSAFLFSCNDGDGINIFTVEDDKALGLQLRDTILLHPEEYPVMDESQFSSQYTYIRSMVDDILASGKVDHADDFDWEIYLIDDNEVLNAFAAPGGYMFVYSGLIVFLDKKDDLAGVLGHEMAHAAERHATHQMTKNFGAVTLLNVLLGEDNELVSNILGQLIGLTFSRSDEEDADEHSVIYLCETEYAANGAATFFEKLASDNSPQPPAFLSTHPTHESRIEDINAAALELGCDTAAVSNQMDWQSFRASFL